MSISMNSALKIATEFARENPGMEYAAHPNGAITVTTVTAVTAVPPLIKEGNLSFDSPYDHCHEVPPESPVCNTPIVATSFPVEKEIAAVQPVAVEKTTRKYRKTLHRKDDPTFNALSDEDKRAKIVSAKFPTDISNDAMKYILNMGVGRKSEGHKLVHENTQFDKDMTKAVTTSLNRLNKNKRLQKAEKIVHEVTVAVSR